MLNERLEERHVMVKEQLEKRGVRNPWVLQAMLDTPRHFFVPPECRELAYEDRSQSIGKGQTISQPYIVASMAELLEPENTDRVLEVGVGSGYSAAVLSQLVSEVLGVEREPDLLKEAEKRFKTLSLTNIQVKLGDGSLGWIEKAPFDGILVTAAAPMIPLSLLAQLKVGGVLIIPVGNRESQKLMRVFKRSEKNFQEKELYGVRFVPLIGKEGWKE
jgi:protein-L-isoaspartate(D-aspartate) O-methyltransferase